MDMMVARYRRARKRRTRSAGAPMGNFAPITISDGQVSGVDSLSAAASQVVNWDIDDAGISKPRAPLVSYSATGTNAFSVTGLEHWNEHVVGTHADGSWWAIPDGGPTAAIAINDTSAPTQLVGGRRPVFALGAVDVYVTAGGQIRRWNRSRAVAELCSGSWRCSHVVAIGDRLVSNDLDDPQFFKWSAIGEGNWTSWPADNASDPSARPDPVVAVADNMNELWIFGSETLQCYQVGSDPLNPYDLISTAGIGLAAPYCYVKMDEQFCFLDNKMRLIISDRRSQDVISDAIKTDLRSLSTVADGYGYRIEQGNNSQLVFRFPTDKRTFAYNLGSSKWSEQNYYSAGFQVDYPAGAYVYWPKYNRHLVGSSLSTGGLYTIGGSGGQDLGGPILCERTTGWHDHGTKNRKRSIRVRITLRRGTAATVSQGNGSFEVRVQDDDKPWTPWKGVNIGGPSEYANVADVFIAGVFKRRRYGFRFSTTEATSFAEASNEILELAA